MRLADRHATWSVGKTSLHLDPHCDHHHLLQQCYPHIKQHHLGEIEVQRGGSGHLNGLDRSLWWITSCNPPKSTSVILTSKLPRAQVGEVQPQVILDIS